MKYLTYIGNGSALPGVPARDLSRMEAMQMGEKNLIASNLYKLTRPAASKESKKPAPSANKLKAGGSENKAKE